MKTEDCTPVSALRAVALVAEGLGARQVWQQAEPMLHFILLQVQVALHEQL